MCLIFHALFVFQIISFSYCLHYSQDDSDFSMVNCFAQESRISELLRLKRSLDKISIPETNYESCNSSVTCTEVPITLAVPEESSNSKDVRRPAALPLTAEKRDYESDASAVDYQHPTWIQKEKPSKLQTIFQITITSLAFLSFGGYLLCLIVQAIKSKGTTYFHPVATATTTPSNGVKRIKIYRRGRRNAEYYKNMELEGLLMALPNPTELSKALLSHGSGFLKMVDIM